MYLSVINPEEELGHLAQVPDTVLVYLGWAKCSTTVVRAGCLALLLLQLC